MLTNFVIKYPNQGPLKTYNTIRFGACQSNNPIDCLEHSWGNNKYVGQTSDRIICRFHGDILDIKHMSSTAVARHCVSCNILIDPRMTVHILEYMMLQRMHPDHTQTEMKGNQSGKGLNK